MRHILALLAMTVIALSAPPGGTAHAAGTSFDSFFKGITRCELTPAFKTFWRGVADRYGNRSGTRDAIIKPGVKIALPDALAASVHLDRATSHNKGDYTLVVVPLSGTFMRTPLKHVEFYLGNENGISIIALEFATSKAALQRAFAKTIAQGQSLLKRKGDEYGTVGFAKDGAGIYCDRST